MLKTSTRIAALVLLIVLSVLVGRQSVRTDPWRSSQSLSTTSAAASRLDLPEDLRPFIRLLSPLDSDVLDSLLAIEQNWKDSYAVMMLEVASFLTRPGIRQHCLAILTRRTGQPFGLDIDRWYDWIWRTDLRSHPEYAQFKAVLYRIVDPRFVEYFQNDPPSTIRLEEIRWGSVRRDGIPPLKNPKMIGATEATYLEDSNVVFGVAINGDARAYPKRILAWHEMFKDTVGGESVNGVYCTLCGSMILYRTTFDGVHHELGTSGFLYRSNKLMYDHATKSLWSTLDGRPVVGPLVGKDIELECLYVVTTTWGEWRKRHAKTQVLSLDTGFTRDYGEGVAYREYFSTDDLMFSVPQLDTRLKNKAEILALRFPEFPDEQLAISADFLLANPIYHDKVGDVAFVVLTDETGANRVYETGGQSFVSWDGGHTVIDQQQNVWRLSEDGLSRDDGRSLRRLPAHRAFWFGWFAVYPETRLVK